MTHAQSPALINERVLCARLMAKSIISESALVVVQDLTDSSDDTAKIRIADMATIATPRVTKFHAPECQPRQIVAAPSIAPTAPNGSPVARPAAIHRDCRRSRASSRDVMTLMFGSIAHQATPSSSQ